MILAGLIQPKIWYMDIVFSVLTGRLTNNNNIFKLEIILVESEIPYFS